MEPIIVDFNTDENKQKIAILKTLVLEHFTDHPDSWVTLEEVIDSIDEMASLCEESVYVKDVAPVLDWCAKFDPDWLLVTKCVLDELTAEGWFKMLPGQEGEDNRYRFRSKEIQDSDSGQQVRYGIIQFFPTDGLPYYGDGCEVIFKVDGSVEVSFLISDVDQFTFLGHQVGIGHYSLKDSIWSRIHTVTLHDILNSDGLCSGLEGSSICIGESESPEIEMWRIIYI